jgi:hypothetical protein
MKHRIVCLALILAGLTACDQPPGPPATSLDTNDAELEPTIQSLAIQPGDIVLSANGTSWLGWLFETHLGWNLTGGNAPGEGDHRGDDYYFDDWNKGSGNSDLGEVVLSPMSGKVIFVGKNPYNHGYGKQVIIQNGDFAFRFSHLDYIDVLVGDNIRPGTPVGTVGCTGLSCELPNTAHLHAGLYRKINDAAAKDGKTALFWLKKGDNPTWLSGGPSHFAAPFNIQSDVAVDFTLEDAASRLSPVLREVSLPDPMIAGNTYDISWTLMGYHGPMASRMQITCYENHLPRVHVVDNEPEKISQGWHWDHAYSHNYEFSGRFTLPAPMDTEDCEVRFYARRLPRHGELYSEDVPEFEQVFLSVLIPGGVDSRTMGTVGRQLERTILGSTSTVSGTSDSYVNPDVIPTQRQAAYRLSPVMVRIELEDDLRAGQRYPVRWEVMGYHGPMSSMVRLYCDQESVGFTDDSPEYLGEPGWEWTPVRADSYGFSTTLAIPAHFSGDCIVRFFWSRQGYVDHNAAFLSVLIPGGVDNRPQGDAGRRIWRTVR